MSEQIKLDLGAQGVSPDGFKPMGVDHGSEIYPLPYANDSVDEIRASHVLEHFPYSQTQNVLNDWARALKPGGILKIAVPNFELIAKEYVAGKDFPIEPYLMGGQTDAHDFHYAVFDDEKLSEHLRLAGLKEIRKWDADCKDCSSLDVSLNMMGIKPKPVVPPSSDPFRVSCIMSVPRLGFMDNFFCAFEAISPMGITIRRFGGAYWHHGIERLLSITLEEDDPSAILTVDYDSIFSRWDVERLIKTMRENPEVDALAAVQSARGWKNPLLTLDLPVGVKQDRITPSVFGSEITKLKTAHFGLTLIRASSLRKAKKPWLLGVPSSAGTWEHEQGKASCIDPDIYFWKNWDESGLTVYSANRVVIGHLELMIRWPGEDFSAVMQEQNEYQKTGKPKGVWE